MKSQQDASTKFICQFQTFFFPVIYLLKLLPHFLSVSFYSKITNEKTKLFSRKIYTTSTTLSYYNFLLAKIYRFISTKLDFISTNDSHFYILCNFYTFHAIMQ